MLRAVLIVLFAATVRAELVDRIAITVGRDVVTELQIDEELRVTAFLNHQAIIRDAEARRSAAARLIEQLLVKREMELSHYPLPQPSELDQYQQQIEDDFGDAARFSQALNTYHLSEATLRDHLSLQLMTMRFIEFRFRPDVNSPADIEARTDQVLDAWLDQTRKQSNIVYLDKSLAKAPVNPK